MKKGFTLLELLTVILIMGVLFGLITSATVKAARSAKEKRMSVDIGTLTAAAKAYRHEYGVWPGDPGNVAGLQVAQCKTVPNANNRYYISGDNSSLINDWFGGRVESLNIKKIRFLSLGDYTGKFNPDGTVKSPGVVSPVNTKDPYCFWYDIVADKVIVATNREPNKLPYGFWEG